MNVFEDRIKPLLDSSGLSDMELERLLGLPRSIIYDWKNGRSKSYKKYIIEIASYFEVSADYLLGKSDTKKAPPAKAESARTKAINDINAILDEMTEDEQQQALNVLRALCANNSKTEK